jgi:hypothetical protein
LLKTSAAWLSLAPAFLGEGAALLPRRLLADRGMLSDDTNVAFEAGERVHLTEKVDGSNTRIVVMPGGGDFFLDTRDLFLYSRATASRIRCR